MSIYPDWLEIPIGTGAGETHFVDSIEIELLDEQLEIELAMEALAIEITEDIIEIEIGG